MKEHTRKRVPLDLTMTQKNLAEVNLAFFDETCEPRYRDDAFKAVGGALEEFHKAEMEFYIARAERVRERKKSSRRRQTLPAISPSAARPAPVLRDASPG
ncbi:MAG: hypothetical protein ACREC0_13070 [Methylocella sp.]